jgi:hypothetical protein
VKMYSLKICREEEKPLLVEFIRNHWQKDHIFTKSDEMLRYQHFNYSRKEFNFILAHNNKTNEVDGIIGIIPVSQYDSALADFGETWGGIWKVRQDVKNNESGMLGLLLFEVFKKYKMHCSIGMSEIAEKMHSIMGYKMGFLNHYYLLNNDISDFSIASIPANEISYISKSESLGYYLKNIPDLTVIPEGSIQSTYYPRKSLTYLINRFQKHPLYKYSFWGVYGSNGKLTTIFVFRTINVDGRKAIRIIDVFGQIEDLGSLKNEFIKILKDNSAEYIDILNHGISQQIIMDLGFKLLDPHGDVIIPNYFEPFLRKNIIINFAYKSRNSCVIFKGDSDQDRPSQIFSNSSLESGTV